MKRRPLGEGYIEGSTYFQQVDPSQRVAGGYALHDSTLFELVDNGVETVVLIEPSRRLASSLDDWQEYGRELDDGWVVLPIRYMGVG